MADKYTVLVEKDEDGWLVSEVVGLPGCHTQAKTLVDLMARTKEAIQAYLMFSKSEIRRDVFVGVRVVEV
ncbi:MAG: type II toxin-antitoxin system HicB family antitoxin [Candidatus Micrarchaeota archaeon]